MPIPVDEYKARLAARLMQEVRTLADFRSRWINPPLRQELLDSLVTGGYSPNVVRMVEEKEDYDLYDVLAELGWGMNPCTRRDRTLAFTYKHEQWIDALPAPPPRRSRHCRPVQAQRDRGPRKSANLPNPRSPGRRRTGRPANRRQAQRLLTETKTRMFAE